MSGAPGSHVTGVDKLTRRWIIDLSARQGIAVTIEAAGNQNSAVSQQNRPVPRPVNLHIPGEPHRAGSEPGMTACPDLIELSKPQSQHLLIELEYSVSGHLRGRRHK